MSATLHCGDVRAVLATLPERSVQCVVTSPPYFGLRDYGVPGQLGLERTPDAYVAAMVGVFRAVRRVLRDDGTLWLNLGDSYAAGGSGDASSKSTLKNDGRRLTGARNYEERLNETAYTRAAPPGLKPKDLIGIPWRVAFALQADGWYLRSDIIWAKPNPMPESVTDRPTKAHEYLFLLTKNERYYYDAAAIAEAADSATQQWRLEAGRFESRGQKAAEKIADGTWTTPGMKGEPKATRNARTVWTIATQPYSGAHFATFPEELARRCILAGSSAKACEHCGAPWERVTEVERRPGSSPDRDDGTSKRYSGVSLRNDGEDGRTHPVSRTVGWQPTCACAANTGSASSVVLDPFGGSGTVASVATGHGRHAIHIDLNPAYLELARQRIGPMICEDAA